MNKAAVALAALIAVQAIQILPCKSIADRVLGWMRMHKPTRPGS